MRLARILGGGALPIIAGAATFALQPRDMPLPSPPLLLLLGLAVGLLLGPLLAYPVTVIGFCWGYLPGYVAHGGYPAGAGLIIIVVGMYALIFPIPGVVITALLALYLPAPLRPRNPFRTGDAAAPDDEP